MNPMHRPRIPKSYDAATWRNSTPSDGGAIGLGFNLADGRVVRLRLDLESARHVQETLVVFLGTQGRCHSDKSAGIPSSAVSTPEEGAKV
jgi:hypothetical protein